MTSTTMDLIHQYAEVHGADFIELRPFTNVAELALEQRIKELERDAAMFAKLSSWTGGGIEVSLDAWRAADKDAKRYRWLRECDGNDDVVLLHYYDDCDLMQGEDLDEAIDRAMSEAALQKLVDISQEYKLP